MLQVREVAQVDNITEPEPWTWIRTPGARAGFLYCLRPRSSCLGKVSVSLSDSQGDSLVDGESRRKSYQSFLAERVSLSYEKREHIPI